MKKTRKPLGAIYEVEQHEPENHAEAEALLIAYESPQDRVSKALESLRAMCTTWDHGKSKDGSADMVAQITSLVHFLAGEIEVTTRRDPWRIADYAISLGRMWAAIEVNEHLSKPITGKRKTAGALTEARTKSAKKRAKITPRKYAIAKKKARGRKEFAMLLKVTPKALRDYERRNNLR